jgi:hypothetical protein
MPMRRLSPDEFWRRVKEANGDRYDYSKAEFTKTTLPITVTCRIHGDFEVQAGAHMRGSNCLKCKHEDTRRRMSGNRNAAVDQRDLFEQVFPIPATVERYGTGYRHPGSWIDAQLFVKCWEGWLACSENMKRRNRG